jgi:hypothetical protein
MATKVEKKMTPPLVSYTSYVTFINELREHGSLPARIDKTLMPKASGSQIAGMLAALKYLGQIDDSGTPTDQFKKFVLATDDDRKELLSSILKERYSFIFIDNNFDLERATSGQMAEKFRSLDITGSTVTKTIAFFLAAAKEAGVGVSKHIKPPPAPKPSSNGKKLAKRKDDDQSNTAPDAHDEQIEGTERFEIPIPGKSSVKVIVPKDLDADDWEMLSAMITTYISRWKKFV